jgi:hypothetical protein
MPINDDRCLPTVVIEGNTAGITGVAKLREKMERYLHPGSPVIFFIGIIIFRRPVKEEEKNFCWVGCSELTLPFGRRLSFPNFF